MLLVRYNLLRFLTSMEQVCGAECAEYLKKGNSCLNHNARVYDVA